MTGLALIWAESAGGVIGVNGALPWHLPEDLRHFKDLTAGQPVVMGRKTWESLPSRFRPLPGRRNIVVTRQPGWTADGAETAATVDAAVQLGEADRPDTVWVIGGATLFSALIGRANRLETTEIRAHFTGDTYAPTLDYDWLTAPRTTSPWLTSASGLLYRFTRYDRPAPPRPRAISHQQEARHP